MLNRHAATTLLVLAALGIQAPGQTKPPAERYPSGGVAADGPRVDGLRHGPWTYYYPDGTKLAEGAHRAGRAHGPWRFYHPNGNLWTEGAYDDERRAGTWRELTMKSGESRSQNYDATGIRVQPELTVVVHSDKTFSVDGKVASLHELEESARGLWERDGLIRYIRESEQTEAPVEKIIDVLINNYVPISMQGPGEPAVDTQPPDPGIPLHPHSPKVAEGGRGVFSEAWKLATRGAGQDGVARSPIIAVTPSRQLGALLEQTENDPRLSIQDYRDTSPLMPTDRPLKFGVIAYIPIGADQETAGTTVPFLGILIGIVGCGHSAVIFEGATADLDVALNEVDHLLVDGDMLPHPRQELVEARARGHARRLDLSS